MAPRRHGPETGQPELHPGPPLDGGVSGRFCPWHRQSAARFPGRQDRLFGTRAAATTPGRSTEDAMVTTLALGLSILVTAALLGWLAVEAERPAPRRGRAGRRHGADLP